MAILAVGFVGKDAQETIEAYGGSVQPLHVSPPMSLVFLPSGSDIGEREDERDCVIYFPGKGGTLSYDRHLDCTQSTIFVEEYPDIVA